MYILAFLILFLPFQAVAKAPECPGYGSKKDCLKAVGQNYDELLDFIEYTDPEKQEDQLILARNVKHYEALACNKTCLN